MATTEATTTQTKTTTKTIFVLGATGTLGIFFCEEALKRGHSLRIFARNPSKLPKSISENASVKITKGKLTDTEALVSTITGSDILVSALGPPFSYSALNVPAGSYTNTYRTIFTTMRTQGLTRIYIMGTPSIRVPGDANTLTLKVMIGLLKVFAHAAWSEVVAVGKLLDEEAGDLEWVMYRIGNLKDKQGEIKAVKHLGDEDWGLDTYRPGIARWLVDEIEKGGEEWVRQKPTLYSKAG